MADEKYIPLAVKKDRIAVIGAARGAVNDEPLHIDGKTWGQGALALACFRGRLNVKTRLYEGVLVLTPATGEELRRFKLSELKGEMPKPLPKPEPNGELKAEPKG